MGSGYSSAPLPVKSITRPIPSGTGSEWIEINSSGVVLERWVWDGSVYLGDIKLKELPDSFLYPLSDSSFSVVIVMPGGSLISELEWCPFCSNGVFNASNYWALGIQQLSTTPLSLINYLLLNNASLANYRRLYLTTGAISVITAADTMALGIRISRIGNPPDIYPGPINIKWRRRIA